MKVYWNDENVMAKKKSILVNFRPGLHRGAISGYILIPMYNYLK